MRLKDLFTVPTGQKVTEKHLRRVLISSICSILLCMTCLVSTTWAWFAVSIENTGNVIEIGTPGVVLKNGDTELEYGAQLGSGTHTIHITHANNPDDFDKKSTLYVTLIIGCDNGTTTVFTTLNQDNQYSTTVNIVNETGKSFGLSWNVSWFTPVNAVALTEDIITLNNENTTEDTTDSATAPMQAATTEPSTEAVTEPSTEVTTSPTTEPSTETTTAPTEEASPEETDPSTETTTASTESPGELQAAA